ncbi:hypothetical protein Godav_026049 [Gossypium davidsonii]|uniref:Uncharacterized protein n=2 Tax=Gossypium TaxID=3633 RepID=A0A7J8TEM7_GOSDV|nr:hypothetical protein [Gossypium davidsonii]MBA0671608.1 hypothetical protein [Gossypium klotzschianum]
MQETGPMLQEFVRMNGLRTPSYPPGIFRPTPTHQNEGKILRRKVLLKSTLKRRTSSK